MNKGIFKKPKNIDIDIYYKLVNDYGNLHNKYDNLQQQLEEKDKAYAKIRDEIYDYLDSNRFCENLENVGNEKNVRKHIFEILERGKNVNSK